MIRNYIVEFCLVAVILNCFSGYGQSQTIGFSGPSNNTIVMPSTTGASGRVDAGALEELTEHLQAVGGGNWSGMQGKGSITYPSANTGPFTATLSILRGDHFRLDVETPDGMRSSRIRGLYGAIKDSAAEAKQILPLETAIVGLVQFQWLRLPFPHFPSASLIDQGSCEIEGVQLHRITMEWPQAQASLSANVAHSGSVIDFYFDPTSHLLMKSATVARINGVGNQDFLRVISYSDYRKVNGVLLPFHYEESLGGQPQWVLQLTEASFDMTLQPSDFSF
ncbi:hypothetical protein [Granulicella arctica]|uniref:Outer membrane lipoprotein-sorting protein n=1 Tax=Granulicella arctica TaxID=940613 RepID=A0A7Y9TV10_9BACT|nr:hypothetical protein [Granulicella arctica]NYF81313.1 hypothetical protein [Granulicella arctica]